MHQDFRYDAVPFAVRRVLGLIPSPGEAVTPQQLSRAVSMPFWTRSTPVSAFEGPGPTWSSARGVSPSPKSSGGSEIAYRPYCGQPMQRPELVGHN